MSALFKIDIETTSIFGNLPGIRFAASQGLAEAMLFWHERMLPAHFTPTAYSRYKYASRNSVYTKRKRRKMGHTRPLVWTGKTEQLSKKITVRAYKGVVRASGEIPTPLYLHYNRTGKTDMANEMTQVAPGERVRLQEVAQQALKRQLRFVPQKRTRKRITA